MNARNRNRMMGRVGLVLLMSLVLEGCQVEDKAQVPMPEKPYILKHDKKSLILDFQGRSSKLPDNEEALLLSSLKPFGPGKASVHITFPNKGSRLSKQRIKNIIRIILKYIRWANIHFERLSIRRVSHITIV